MVEDQMLTEASVKAGEGEYKQALDLFHRILEDNPTSGDAYLGIGDIYLEQQDYQRAEPALGRAAALDPRKLQGSVPAWCGPADAGSLFLMPSRPITGH